MFSNICLICISFANKDIYCKKLKGENLNQNELLKVISAKNMGTFYFPQVVEFKEMQNQRVKKNITYQGFLLQILIELFYNLDFLFF